MPRHASAGGCATWPSVRDPSPLAVSMTQEHLAEMAGTSRATVNRVLREEERRGTVALSRGCTTVIDLEDFAPLLAGDEHRQLSA